jgi:hypothetical protein
MKIQKIQKKKSLAFERKQALRDDDCSFQQEGNRFSSTEWIQLANITLFHVIFPWVLFTDSFSLMKFNQKKYQGFYGRILFIFSIFFSPIATKLNVFWERFKITRLRATNPANFLREKAVKDLKKSLSKTDEESMSDPYRNAKVNAKEALGEMSG